MALFSHMSPFKRAVFVTAACAFFGAAALSVSAKEPAAKTPPAKETAGAQSAKAKAVDRNEVLSLYMEGEFQTLVFLLENIRRERQLRDREDSIFIYKFLGVIYGADERTKRKAEAFLYQMLELDPNEDLSSLGVGESVQKIFERVRARVQADTTLHHPAAPAPVAAAPAAPAPAPAAATPAPAPQAASESRKKGIPTWVWLASGGVVAATAVTFIVLNQDPDPHVHAISDTLK